MVGPGAQRNRHARAIGTVVALVLVCTATGARADHTLSSAEHVVVDGLRCASTGLLPVRFTVESGRARVTEPADVTCTMDGSRITCAGNDGVVLSCAPMAPRDAEQTLFVLDVVATEADGDEELVRMVTSVILERAARHARFAVTSAGDVRALLENAGARATFDIDDTPALGALGTSIAAGALLASTVSVSDGLLVVRLRLIDVEKARLVAHARADGRDALELFRRLRLAVDDLLSGREAPLPAVDLGRRVDDSAALLGALVAGAFAGGTLAVLGAMPVAAATLARGSSAPAEVTTPVIFCCACASACSVPAAVGASLVVDRELGYEAGVGRSTIVGLSAAGALALAPAIPLSLLVVVFVAVMVANPAATDDELLAQAGPPAVLAMAAGVLVAPLLAFAAAFTGYEVGIAFLDDTPLSAAPGDE